jgi:tetratricopeptide (TPR) repeat protein
MSFTVREVSAMLGLSTAQVRSYASRGVLKPERGERGELRFGFQDLVILRTASDLTAARVPERRVRRVLRRLREQLPDEQSITGVRLAADGEQIIVRDGDAVWNAESGQKLFDFEVPESRSLEVAPRDTATSTPRDFDAEDVFEIASELEVASPAEARAAYEKVIELDPEHVDAHVNLGRMLHEEGAPAAAEKHYRVALEIDPQHSVAAFNLGVALEDLGRLKDAVEAYRLALKIDPENADAHYNIAGIYERKGDKAGALRHLKAYRTLVR